MGTSLSGLTPATTFDGLLKVGDNDPLTADLKAISTGDGTDTMLELSTTALQIGGATGMYWDNTNKRLGINNTSPSQSLDVDGNIRTTSNIYINGNGKYIYSNLSGGAVEAGLRFKPQFLELEVFTQGSVAARFGTTTRAYIQGSGATSATTSLLVQNSDDTSYLKFRDDGLLDLKIASTSSNTAFRLLDLNGATLFRVLANKNGYISGNFGVGNDALTARLHVKGSGATSATTALLVQNSAGTDMLKVTDDGITNVRSSLIVNHPSVSSRKLTLGWGAIFAEDNSAELYIGAVYSQVTAPRIVLGGKTRTGGADAVLVQALNGMYVAPTASTEDPSAQLHIKGSGNDATTTALLVQNSDTTPLDLFKILDDGTLVAPNLPTSATGLPTGAIWNDNGTLKIV